MNAGFKKLTKKLTESSKFSSRWPFINLLSNNYFLWLHRWKCRLQFGPPFLNFRRKISSKKSQNFNYKEKTYENETLHLKLYLWLLKTTLKNCWRKLPGVGKFSAPTRETFQEHKIFAKKSNTKIRSSGRSDGKFDKPRRKFRRKVRKDVARLPVYYFYPEKDFFRDCSSGHVWTICVNFPTKTRFFTLLARILIQNRSFLNKIFPQIVPLLVLNAFLTILTKLSTESSKLFRATDF